MQLLKKVKVLAMSSIFCGFLIPLCAWDDHCDDSSDRFDRQFDNTRPAEGGYDWSKLERDGQDRDSSSNEQRGTIRGPDDSKD